MEVSSAIVGALITQYVALIAGVTWCRVTAATNSRRIGKLEKKVNDDIPKDYVPRLEMERILEHIDRNAEETHALLRAVIVAGGDHSVLIKQMEASADRTMHSISEDGLALTRSFEGLRILAYRDGGGVWTIGYGHTHGVTAGQTCTVDQAEQILRADMAAAVACVNHAVTVAINQHQFDALSDFAFNCGTGNFVTSTLLKLINESKFEEAAEQFGRWVHDAHGNEEPGLVHRRGAEAALFRKAA